MWENYFDTRADVFFENAKSDITLGAELLKGMTPQGTNEKMTIDEIVIDIKGLLDTLLEAYNERAQEIHEGRKNE